MRKKYSDEESEILSAFEAGLLLKSKAVNNEIIIAKKTALNTFAKTKHISIKLTEKEVDKLKAKAIETGLSYQSLISALIHNYTDNRIHLTL